MFTRYLNKAAGGNCIEFLECAYAGGRSMVAPHVAHLDHQLFYFAINLLLHFGSLESLWFTSIHLTPYWCLPSHLLAFADRDKVVDVVLVEYSHLFVARLFDHRRIELSAGDVVV